MQFLQKLFAEFFGTAILVSAIIGSAFMGANLTSDGLISLLVNGLSTIFILGLLIFLLGPISGAHFNPAVSIALALSRVFPAKEVLPYCFAQITGAIAGAGIGNLMFGSELYSLSQQDRFSLGTGLGELVATSLLVLTILMLVRNQRQEIIPIAVSAVIGSAYFFTSSTSFANPAVTIGRIFTDSPAGIAIGSVPGFTVAQLLGVVVALGLLATFAEKKA